MAKLDGQVSVHEYFVLRAAADLDGKSLLVFLLLRHHAGNTDRCSVPEWQLAQEAKCTRRTVQTAIAQLIKEKLVCRIVNAQSRTSGRATVYRVSDGKYFTAKLKDTRGKPFTYRYAVQQSKKARNHVREKDR